MSQTTQQQQQQPLSTVDGNVRHANTDQTTGLNPLSEKNAKPVPAFSGESQQHQSLHGKLMKQQKTGQQAGSYVSPSDDIMSPASSKLNAFKQKRFAKATKPRSLFAKTSQTPADISSGPNTPTPEKK